MSFERRISPMLGQHQPCWWHLARQIVPGFLRPAHGGRQQPEPPFHRRRGGWRDPGLALPAALPQRTLCSGSIEWRSGVEPPRRGSCPVLGAAPGTPCSQSCDLTTRSCFLLKLCKSTSARQVPGGLWWAPAGVRRPAQPSPRDRRTPRLPSRGGEHSTSPPCTPQPSASGPR